MSGIGLRRLGVLMEPAAGDPREVEGVLNPAAARGPDGELYLFPRLVGRHNYSRIGIARVRFDDHGDPCAVERIGIALEPEADYERRPGGGGGCEDPRVTYIEPLSSYVMTYTAFSAAGPRIALAVSEDLLHWRRTGLVTFSPYRGLDSDGIDDKDASVFPVAIPNPTERAELAILHRPLFPGSRPEETACHRPLRVVDLDRESIWISYCPMNLDDSDGRRIGRFTSHHRLATPVSPWERLKIGGGTPPVLTRHGWLVVYHGVSDASDPDTGDPELCYAAGVMILSEDHPQKILYRSAHPVLSPETPQERRGTIADVVFPTGIDRRDDLGHPDRFDVYYGMADFRIGVARLDLPDVLPDGASTRPASTV
ncbi:MAG: glycosidase [Actinomycetota bacterium]|nr:glycosidase [Actinomycetota bacterium]